MNYWDEDVYMNDYINKLLKEVNAGINNIAAEVLESNQTKIVNKQQLQSQTTLSENLLNAQNAVKLTENSQQNNLIH